MRCYVHGEKEAIGACVECGKFVCEACNVEVDGKTICKACIQKQTKTRRSERREKRKERTEGKYERHTRKERMHDKEMHNLEFERGEKRNVVSRFSLFLLTFFVPPGFNYLALGLKRRAIAFFVLSSIIGLSLISPFILYLEILNLRRHPEAMEAVLIAHGFIFMFYPIINLMIFRDVLRIRSRMANGMEIDDGVKDLVKFFKSYKATFLLVIFALIVMNTMAMISALRIRFLSDITFMISFPLLLMLFLAVPYLVFRSFRGINGVTSKRSVPSVFEKQVDKKQVSEKELVEVKVSKESKNELVVKGEALARRFNEKSNALYNTNIGDQVREIADITYKMISYIEKEPEKARVLNKFIEYYMPTTLELLDNYEILKKQNLSGKNIEESSRKIERTMDNMVLAFRKQADMLFEEKALNIDAEISVLDDLLKREGLL